MIRPINDDTQAGTRRLGRFVVGILLLAALTVAGPSAWAYWTSSGDGTGSATTATLNPPSTPVLTHTSGTQSVGVSWTAPATAPDGLVPDGYYVTRIPDGGGPAAEACGSSPALLVPSSCTDLMVPAGSYRYTVTAVYRTWTATSGPSDTVAVATDRTAPVVTVTSVNRAARVFPYSTNADVTEIGGECGEVPGDSDTVTPLIGGAATSPASATCSAGTWTLTLTTPVSAEGSISVSATQADAVGNPGTAPAQTVVVDKTRPTLTSIVRVGASQLVKSGPLSWTVTFSEPVSGVGASTFALAMSGIGGTTPAVSGVTSAGPSPSATWTVSVSAAGATGTNAGSIGLNLALPNGSVLDPAGNTLNAGTVTGPAYTFDTTAPAVVRVSSPLDDGSYRALQAVPVTVEFTEPVTVTGTPQLTLVTGAPATTAVGYTSGSGGTTLTFTYTVAAGNSSTDLNYQAVTSLALGPGGAIADAATNAASLTLPAPAASNSLGGNKALVIDTTAPAVAVTRVNNAVSTFPYATTGNVASVGGTCGTAAGDLAPVTVLVNGTSVGTVSCSAGGAWTLPTPTWTTEAARIVSATQADGAGNTGTALPQAVTIDRTAPRVIGVSSTLANGSYKAGQKVPVTVTFSEPVVVTGTPRLTLRTGSPANTAVNYTTGSGSDTLIFEYTVIAGNTSADLEYGATNSLSSAGTILDAVNFSADRALPVPGAAGSLGATKDLVIDTAAPTVANVSSSLGSGAYKAGQVIPVTVTFSEPVIVTGTPRLTLATGSPTATPVDYTSGSGTTILTFGYTVVAGNTSADLDYQATTSLALNLGTITDLATNAATLTLPAPGAANSLGANRAIVIDTTAPVVTGVTSPLGNGTYRAGQVVPVTVTFSEPVTVTGSPQLALSTGSPATTGVNYTSGSGTATLTFTYTVVAGNLSPDLDYAATNSLMLNGGTIADAAGNAATLTLAAPGAAGSLGNAKNLVIDAVPPAVTVTSVNGPARTFPYSTAASLSSLGGTCGTATGDVATVSPRIGGAATTPATAPCLSGSWALTLTTPLATSATRIVSATQMDAAGNTGTAPDQTVIIDKTPPTLSSIVRTGPSQLVNAGPLSWTVTFSEPVSGLVTTNFGLTTSGLSGSAPAISGVSAVNGSPSATWTVSVGMGGVNGTDGGTIGLNLTGSGAVVDAVGNALSTTSLTGATYTYDTAKPTVGTVSSSLANGSYRAGQVVPVTVTFSEPVLVTGTPQLILATGTTSTTAVEYTSGSGGSTLTFEYTIAPGHTSADLDYRATDSLVLNGGAITDAAGNAATPALPSPGASNSLGANKALVIDTTPPVVTVTDIEPLNLWIFRLLRVAGTAEVGAGPVTVFLCDNLGPSCDATNATQTFTNVAVDANGTWQTGWSIQGQGTWYASATQTDAAGNVGTSPMLGPITN